MHPDIDTNLQVSFLILFDFKKRHKKTPCFGMFWEGFLLSELKPDSRIQGPKGELWLKNLCLQTLKKPKHVPPKLHSSPFIQLHTINQPAGLQGKLVDGNVWCGNLEKACRMVECPDYNLAQLGQLNQKMESEDIQLWY